MAAKRLQVLQVKEHAGFVLDASRRLAERRLAAVMHCNVALAGSLCMANTIRAPLHGRQPFIRSHLPS
jgi:hypothetical protein